MDLNKIVDNNAERLSKKKNVVAVAVGKKWSNGQPTDEDAIIVLVDKKEDISSLKDEDKIESEIEGIKTDVVGRSGKFRKLGFRNRQRPAFGGVSCGHPKITAGTLGGVFLDKHGHRVVLSNNHVLACYDDLTEVLTKDGFKKFSDVKQIDEIATLNDGHLEYQMPTDIMSYYYNGKMHHFESKYIDLLVTPNHKLYCRKDYRNSTKNSKYELIRADNVEIVGNKTIRFNRTSKWNGIESEVLPKELKISDLDSWLKFLGLFLAEGSTTYQPPYKKRSQRSEQYITQIRNLDMSLLHDCKQWLKNAGFHSFVNKNGYYLRSYNKNLYQYLKQFGKCRDKFIPTEIKQLPPCKLEIILETLSLGDGCIPSQSKRNNIKNHIFTLSSKRLIDDLQEISIKLNGTSSTFIRYGSTFNPNGIYYTCNMIWTNLEPKIRSYNIIDYSGYVYCVEVPNHIILVRRNGKICWSGNSENKAKIGDHIYQPGPHDGGSYKDRIATLHQFKPIKKGVANKEDSAIAIINGKISDKIKKIGKPVGFNLKPRINQKVMKSGRTTGYTKGKIIGTNATIFVSYDMGTIKFKNQIITSYMSEGGDSGSLLIDGNKRVVGLLFAGSDTMTVHNPIKFPKKTYGLRIISDKKTKSKKIKSKKKKARKRKKPKNRRRIRSIRRK